MATTLRSPIFTRIPPRDVGWRAHYGAQTNIGLLATGLKPFNQVDWPLPKSPSPYAWPRTFLSQGLNVSTLTPIAPGEDTVTLRGALIAPRYIPDPRRIDPLAQSNILTILTQNLPPASMRTWPLPRAADYPISNRTHIDRSRVWLLGLDTFFNGPGNGPDYDWPLPKTYPPQAWPRTWLQSTNPAFVLPFSQHDWPLPPRGPFQPVRSWSWPLQLNLLGRDVLALRQQDWPLPGRPFQFERSYRIELLPAILPPQEPALNRDWPLPRGASYPITNRTWLSWAFPFGGNVPLAQRDWPLPRPAIQPVRSWLWSLQPEVGYPPFRQQDWPLPNRLLYPYRSWTQGLSALLQPSTAWSLIAHTTVSGANSPFTTSGINTVGANLIVVATSQWAQAAAGSLTDSLGNTWTPVQPPEKGSTADLSIFYCVNPVTGPSQTFTYSFGAGSNFFATVCVAAFNGSTVANPLNQSSVALVTGTSIQAGVVITGTPGELVVAGLAYTGAAASPTINAGFQITDEGTGGVAEGGALAYALQAVPGSVNPTWSWTGSGESAAGLATFRAALLPSPPFIMQDWPLPRGAVQPVRSWLNSFLLELAGKDILPTRQQDWPLPIGRAFPSALRSWLQTFNLELNQGKPFAQYDWPLPIRLSIFNRSWFWTLNSDLTLLIPFSKRDWPLPIRARQPDRTYVWNYILSLLGQDQLPNRQMDWPVPKTVPYPVPVRSEIRFRMPTALSPLFADSVIQLRRPMIVATLRTPKIIATVPRSQLVLTFVPNRTMDQAINFEPPINVGEQRTPGFDFGPALASGVTLVGTPAVTCTVSSVSQTQDATPQARVLSTPIIVSSEETGAAAAQVNVLFGNCVGDVWYLLVCTAQTSDGQTLVDWGRWYCRQPM